MIIKEDKNKNRQSNDISWRRFQKHMPRSNDLTLIILKGHLLVEQEMNDIINSSLSEPEALLEARITFSQRLAIIKSIYGSSDSEFPYDSIQKLNVLRNQLVHNLEPDNLEKKIVEFVQDLGDPRYRPEYSEMKIDRRLVGSIAFLCGLICGYREGYEILAKQ